MDIRIESKKEELDSMIVNAIEEVFVDAHGIINTISGDITPEQTVRLDASKNAILKVLCEQLEQNLPKLPQTQKDVMSNFDINTRFVIDTDRFDKIVEKAYGGSYEIVAEQEMSNNSVIDFEVPSSALFFDGDVERIKMGNYSQYEIHKIVQCLYEDGLLVKGRYQIKANW